MRLTTVAYQAAAHALLLFAPDVLAINLRGPFAVTYAGGFEVPETAPVVSAATQTHGPFTGRPEITGALRGTVLGTAITPGPPSPQATTYPSDGQLHNPMPAPFVPGGGLGTNGTMPVYRVQSDYDYQSVALALYMYWLQFDLFQTGVSQFSEDDFDDAGLTSEVRTLIQWMADQSLGHVTLLTNVLGSDGPQQCQYNFPFQTVLEFVDFAQKITRVTESTIYGFLPHLDSRPVASLLLTSVSISARQQLIFRQIEGLFPMPVWFEAGIPQSWGWSLISPFIASCPGPSRLVWQIFPPLTVVNQPNPLLANGSALVNQTYGPGLGSANLTGVPPDQLLNATNATSDCPPGITRNRTALTSPDRPITLSWGSQSSMLTGPNNSYVPSGARNSPSFVAWVTQTNVTYSPLLGATGGNVSTGQTEQPDLATFAGDPAINGTVFIALTDSNPFLTPFNLSLINSHVVAGPALYQAG